MSNKIKYLAKNGILIQGEKDGVAFEVKFSDIEPYWEYATEEDFEGGKAKIRDNYLLFNMLTAQGQGGIIAAWDLSSNKIVHLQDGAYTVDFTIWNNEVYQLCYVANYATKAHFSLWKCPFNIKDIDCEGTEIPGAEVIPADLYCIDSDVSITVNENQASISCDGQQFIIPLVKDGQV